MTERSAKRPLPRDFFTPISKRAGVAVEIGSTVAGEEIGSTIPAPPTRSMRSETAGHASRSECVLIADQVDCATPIGKLGSRATTSSASRSSVPGLQILPGFITQAEEARLLAFLDARPWRDDLSRRTMHFGGTYCLYSKDRTLKPQILQAPPVPGELNWLIDRFVDAGLYSDLGGKVPDYVIVNEYRDAQGISAHTENFSFHSPVLGLSLGSSDVMKFRELSEPFDGSVRSGKAGKAPRTGTVVDVALPGRSLCVMADDSRWRWQHEITPRKRRIGFRRVSLTFRVKK